MASTATRIILEPPSERSLELTGRAERRDASSSVAPVASGYERGVGGKTSSREPPAPASLALAHRTPSAKRHSEGGSALGGRSAERLDLAPAVRLAVRADAVRPL